MIRSHCVSIAIALLACLTRPAAAQIPTARSALITGRVLDANSLAGLTDVEVRLYGASTSTSTNARGEFRLAAHPGAAAILLLRRIGYEPVGVTLDLHEGDSLHIATRMTPVPRVLDTVPVITDRWLGNSARLGGFERRRRMGQGTFYTVHQLERTHYVTIGDLLREVPSLEVRGDNVGTIVSARGRATMGGDCPIRVLVDGHLMPLGGPIPVSSPKEVRGIEVYAGPAAIPLELVTSGRFAYCGLIVIWTK